MFIGDTLLCFRARIDTNTPQPFLHTSTVSVARDSQGPELNMDATQADNEDTKLDLLLCQTYQQAWWNCQPEQGSK